MKKYFIYLNVAVIIAFLYSSCDVDKGASYNDDNSYVNVSFTLSTSDLKTKGIVDVEGGDVDDNGDSNLEETTGLCWTEDVDDFDFKKILENNDGYEYLAKIRIYYNVDKNMSNNYPDDNCDEFDVPLYVGTNSANKSIIVTEAFSLIKPGENYKHVIDRILIVQSDKDKKQKIAFSTVRKGSEYATLVRPDHLMPIDLYVGEQDEAVGYRDGIKIDDIDKTPIPISLLCAVEEKAPNFGYSIWVPNFVRVVCLPYSVNVKTDPCDYASSDSYGNTQLSIYQEITDDNIQTGQCETFKLVYESKTDKDNRVGKICFSDQGAIDNDKEIYHLELIVNFDDGKKATIKGDIPLKSLWNYKESGYWEVPKGSNNTNGYIHFDLYNIDLTKSGPIKPKYEGKNQWNLSVEIPYFCSGIPEYCEGTDLNDFANFVGYDYPEDTDPACKWLSSYAVFGCNCNYKYIVMGYNGILVSPVVSLIKGEYIAIGAKSFNPNKFCYNVQLIPLNLNSLDQVVTYDNITKKTCPDDDVEEIFSGVVPANGYYRLQIEALKRAPGDISHDDIYEMSKINYIEIRKR